MIWLLSSRQFLMFDAPQIPKIHSSNGCKSSAKASCTVCEIRWIWLFVSKMQTRSVRIWSYDLTNSKYFHNKTYGPYGSGKPAYPFLSVRQYVIIYIYYESLVIKSLLHFDQLFWRIIRCPYVLCSANYSGQ